LPILEHRLTFGPILIVALVAIVYVDELIQDNTVG
jgi:hypothetical protein